MWEPSLGSSGWALAKLGSASGFSWLWAGAAATLCLPPLLSITPSPLLHSFPPSSLHPSLPLTVHVISKITVYFSTVSCFSACRKWTSQKAQKLHYWKMYQTEKWQNLINITYINPAIFLFLLRPNSQHDINYQRVGMCDGKEEEGRPSSDISDVSVLFETLTNLNKQAIHHATSFPNLHINMHVSHSIQPQHTSPPTNFRCITSSVVWAPSWASCTSY